MDSELYQAYLLQCHQIAILLRDLPLTEMSAAISRADTMGPILDPTLWMRNHQAMDEDAAVVRALLSAQRQLPTCPALPEGRET